MGFKEARESANLTQVELGKLISVPQSTIASWELGISLPRARTLIKLAETLNCSIDELLGVKKRKTNKN